MAATIVAIVAVPTPSADAGARPTAAPPDTTRLTLAVRGCEGCRLRLQQAVEDRAEVWSSTRARVDDGTVSWTVPTRRTHGLSITDRAPWDGGTGAVPVVVFRYAGAEPGDPMSNSTAKRQRRASACWAGTGRDRVTLRVRVVHAHATDPTGAPIRTPRAFTSVTKPFWKPMYAVRHGIAGTQDAVFCRRP